MRCLNKSAFLIPLVLLSACHFTASEVIPAIGIDSSGNPAQVLVPRKEYAKRLTAISQSIHDSALQVLSRHPYSSENEKARWKLSTVVFGFGVNTQIGIGPFKVGAYPRIRLIFNNTKDLYIP